MANLNTQKSNMNEATITPESLSLPKKVFGSILRYVPGLIVFGLIALYYIQLSHMGA